MEGLFENARESKLLLHKLERKLFIYDHADLGAELLGMWQLPEAVIEAIKYHHRPELADRFPAETATVHFADILTHAMDWGGSGEQFVPPLSEEVGKRLGFKPGILAEVMREADRQFIEVVNIMLQDPGR
jgi:HD-like signal output (HDOD) protein